MRLAAMEMAVSIVTSRSDVNALHVVAIASAIRDFLTNTQPTVH